MMPPPCDHATMRPPNPLRLIEKRSQYTEGGINGRMVAMVAPWPPGRTLGAALVQAVGGECASTPPTLAPDLVVSACLALLLTACCALAHVGGGQAPGLALRVSTGHGARQAGSLLSMTWLASAQAPAPGARHDASSVKHFQSATYAAALEANGHPANVRRAGETGAVFDSRTQVIRAVVVRGNP